MRYIVILLILTGCAKTEQRVSSAQSYFFYTNVSAQNAGTIQGVKTTCDVVKFKGSDKKSLSITMYLSNGLFIQTGFHTSFGSTLPFTGVYSGSTQVPVNISVINNPVLMFGQRQSFAIYKVGGNIWRTQVDGIDCFEIDFGSDLIGYNPVLYTEMYASRAGRFPNINFYPAIELYNGTWQGAASGAVSACYEWGLEGSIQNTSLQMNEVNIGSSYNQLNAGPVLWNDN